jgi:hypothetical protein
MRQLLVLSAVSLIAVAGCEEKKSTPVVPKTVTDATKAVTNAASDAKDKLVSGFQKAMDEGKSQLDSWANKLKDAPADKKPAMQSAYENAQAKWNEAQGKLTDLKNSAGSEWEKMSSGVTTAMDNLKKALTDAAAAFK